MGRILWEEHVLPNQTWILEPLKPLDPPPTAPTWRSITGNNFPPYPVEGGLDSNSRAMYVARAKKLDAIFRAGNASPFLPGICRVVYGSVEMEYNDFDVLVAAPGAVKWVTCLIAQLHPTRIPAGNASGSRPVVVETGTWGTMFSVRKRQGAILSAGWADSTSLTVWIGGLDGKVTSYKAPDSCEVLCYTT